ncbi:MAG: hypothetical protein DMD25_16380 [Gemmatimonadetes bacterium]|nr:MAG: hypothetical protein DMD25_16380 [Gemmatimonadota bacterium]
MTVGNNGQIVFISAHNSTANPAVDTVAVGGTVTWTWTNNLGVSHSVQSQGSTAFASSPIMSGSGQTYAVTFTAPGTYQYDCAVHGTAMTGHHRGPLAIAFGPPDAEPDPEATVHPSTRRDGDVTLGTLDAVIVEAGGGPNRLIARSCALRRSSSRSRGGAVV